MPSDTPPPPTPPKGAMPSPDGQPPDIRAVLREVLGEVLPLFERGIMDQVEARLAELPKPPDIAAITGNVVASLWPQITAQLNDRDATVQAKVNEGFQKLQGAAQSSPSSAQGGQAQASQPSPQETAADKVVGATQKILAMLDTAVDSLLPKALDNYGKWKMIQSPWMQDMNAIAMLKQQDPVRAAIMGQMLVGPNPYDQTIPQAMLNGAMWGMKIREAAKGGAAWLPNSAALGTPNPSSGSFVVPSLPSPTPSAPIPPVSNAVMQTPPNNGRQTPSDKSPMMPVLRLRPVPRASGQGTGQANGTPRAKTLADVLG